MNIDITLTAAELRPDIERLWAASAGKIRAIQQEYPVERGAPVFTADGRYTARGWTAWTQGFQYGSAILQFDATGETEFLEIGRQCTTEYMAEHLTHFGVHDHGFNNVSTYGNLWRLLREGRVPAVVWEMQFYELALKCSGAVQARRWTSTPDGGFIHSFNGPHSLFADTIRSLRVLALAHCLGHVLMGEQDEAVSLLDRLLDHLHATLTYNVYYGRGRDRFDVRGRVAHESVFNTTNGCYRCPNSQQGYSPFSTWTRGLAWVMCGCAEQLEFLDSLTGGGGSDRFAAVRELTLEAARATCDFYIDNTAADGIPYWDTGAPSLHRLGEGYLARAADPYNDHEPVDSSAAAIGAQGLLRLGHWLRAHGENDGERYWQAGLTTARALLRPPYLCEDPLHHGLILHSIYHHPNGWDHVPPGRRIPCGEASMWGDYHAREMALYLQRIVEGGPYLTFFATDPATPTPSGAK